MPDTKDSARHDQFFKVCIENAELRKQFINKYILDSPYINKEYRDKLKIDINNKSLAQLPTEFTRSKLSTIRADVIFAQHTHSDEKGRYDLILHIEHQSTSDAHMSYRMMGYRMAIEERNQTPHQGKYSSSFIYPLLVQTVYYTGSARWQDNAARYIKHGSQEDLTSQLGTAAAERYQLISLQDTAVDTDLIKKDTAELSMMEYLMQKASQKNLGMLESWKELQEKLGDALGMNDELLKFAIVYSTAKMSNDNKIALIKWVTEQGNKKLEEAMTVLTDEQAQAFRREGEIRSEIRQVLNYLKKHPELKLEDTNLKYVETDLGLKYLIEADLDLKHLVEVDLRHILQQDDIIVRDELKKTKTIDSLYDQYRSDHSGQTAQSTSTIDIAGSGSQDQDILANKILPYHKSFNKYHADGLDNILSLRLQELDINTDQARIVSGNYGLSESRDGIGRILQAVNKLDSTVTALVPYNIAEKHWVGFIITKDIRMIDSTIDINYIDPENNPIPARLVAAIKVANNSSDVVINISQQEITEMQKYGNCGPEIIENFVEVLTGARHTQEYAVTHHSRLVEKQLLAKTVAKDTSPTDLVSAFNGLLISDFIDSTDHAASDVATLGAFAESFDVAA